MDAFNLCRKVNDHLNAGREKAARDEQIRLLAYLEANGEKPDPLVNDLTRAVGLFPYMDMESSSWQERLVYEAFKVDVGEDEPVALHIEQSRLLKRLLDGTNVAVSAPTSFGKSFVIDSFISLSGPKNVVIIVPTIALADETRRRLHRKFSRKYKIITTSDQQLAEKNILIFPQERAIRYASVLEEIDILIVDEFYKASASFDKERSPSLIRAIVELGKIARQRYFLAPNISHLSESPFTRGMEFLKVDFNTVFLQQYDVYKEIGSDQKKKAGRLKQILRREPGKTLIYAGTYPNIDRVSESLIADFPEIDRPLLDDFGGWLEENYEPNWILPKLIRQGTGIHNGRLHRSLTQLQVRLFEESHGLDRLISTSSIIEGVNTSAETVILWSNKNGKSKIDDFTYKNIMGRSGRMFRHFIGKVYILEEPPAEDATQLELDIPDELLGSIDVVELGIKVDEGQRQLIDEYREALIPIVGEEAFRGLHSSGGLQNTSRSLTSKIAGELSHDEKSWHGIGYLNSNNPSHWEAYLYKLIRLQPSAWGIQYSKYVQFVQVLSKNWTHTLPQLLEQLDPLDIGIHEFFELERNTTYRLSSLLSDVQTIYNAINPTEPVDVSLACSRFAHAFLPGPVFQLEEYGLPRMVSRKLFSSGLIDFEREGLGVHEAIDKISEIGYKGISESVAGLGEFDLYILRYFFEGIGCRDVAFET